MAYPELYRLARLDLVMGVSCCPDFEVLPLLQREHCITNDQITHPILEMQRCDLFQADVQRLTRVIRDATRRHSGVSSGDTSSRSLRTLVYVQSGLDSWLSGKSRSSQSQDRTVKTPTRAFTADKSRSRVSSLDAETAQLRHTSDRPSRWRLSAKHPRGNPTEAL